MCSVHRGTFNTSGVFSTSEDITSDIISTLEKCSVHRGEIMGTSGDAQYIGGRGGYQDVCGRYHQYIGVFNINQRFYQLAPPHESRYPVDVQNIPRCTQDIPPMYSRYSPDVLKISPRCTQDIPQCTQDIPLMY